MSIQVHAGDRVGKLTLLREVEPKKYIRADGRSGTTRRVECLCDCGNHTILDIYSFYGKRKTLSCGCLVKEVAKVTVKERAPQRTHGLSHTYIYKNVWRSMVSRCYKHTDNRFKYYGGRGIKICDEWLNNFKAFYDWAYANGYKEEILPNGKNKWTIDRIDVNGNYCPENCRWVTNAEQAKNKRKRVK